MPSTGLLQVSWAPSLGVMIKPEVDHGNAKGDSRECKLEAVKLVTDRGAAVAQAVRGLGLHENVL